jgi:hypothetical protein
MLLRFAPRRCSRWVRAALRGAGDAADQAKQRGGDDRAFLRTELSAARLQHVPQELLGRAGLPRDLTVGALRPLPGPASPARRSSGSCHRRPCAHRMQQDRDPLRGRSGGRPRGRRRVLRTHHVPQRGSVQGIGQPGGQRHGSRACGRDSMAPEASRPLRIRSSSPADRARFRPARTMLCRRRRRLVGRQGSGRCGRRGTAPGRADL